MRAVLFVVSPRNGWEVVMEWIGPGHIVSEYWVTTGTGDNWIPELDTPSWIATFPEADTG